jgi:hypothetical protein
MGLWASVRLDTAIRGPIIAPVRGPDKKTRAAERNAVPEKNPSPPPPDPRPTGPKTFLVVVLGVPLLYLAAIIVLSAVSAPPARLSGLDVVAAPGERIELKARLEWEGPGFLKVDVSSAEIEFLGPAPLEIAGGATFPDFPDPEGGPPPGAARLGSTRTGTGGIARLDLEAPRSPGLYAVWVRPADPRGLRLGRIASPLTIDVVDPSRPVVLVAIDDVLFRTKMGPLLAGRPAELPPLPGAREALIEAAAKDRIVYLSNRSSLLAERLRGWLAAHRFPAGPILIPDRPGAIPEGEFEGEVGRMLKAEASRAGKGGEVRCAIAGTIAAGRAHASNRIQCILVGVDPAKVTKELEGRLHAVKDWEEARKILAR